MVMHAADAKPGPGTGAGFITTVALAMGVGPLLLHALTAMSPLIVAELDLSRTQFGTFATVAFVAAALASRVAGNLVDLINERVSMIALFAGSGAAILVATIAPVYGWMVLAVILSGLIQAVSNPVTNLLIATRTPLARRGIVMGIKQAGVQMAQAFAGLALPALALLAGWRASLAVAAAPALLGLVLTLRYIPTGTTAQPSKRAGRARLPATVWWLAAYAFLSGFAVQAANVYLPLYGYQGLGFASAAAGALTAVVGAVGLVARIAWGQIASRTGAPRRILVLLAASSAAGIVLVLLAAVVHGALVWVGAILVGATGIASNVVLMVIVLRVAPEHLVGRATGALVLGMYLGFAAGPVAFGGLVDATGDYLVGWAMVLIGFLVTGLLALLRRDWAPSGTG